MSAYSDLSPGWQAAWAQGWEAYQTGNKAIGSAIINSAGAVLAVGRNRTREARQVSRLSRALIWPTPRSTSCSVCPKSAAKKAAP